MTVRPPAVAGTFYPSDPDALRRAVDDAFAGAAPPVPAEPAPPKPAAPKALIVPHAGYIYSGPIAASAYRRLIPARSVIRRVVLLGPSHRVPLEGVAASSADAFATPLGLVAVERTPGVPVNDAAHAREHSLEVQLPFLQTVLDELVVVPLVVGHCAASEVAALLDELWGGPETIVIVSTDLSHYHPYADAVVLDRRTMASVAALRPDGIGDRDACGAYPLRGLLVAAGTRRLAPDVLDLRNSGDTAGDFDQVVGYGAVAIG